MKTKMAWTRWLLPMLMIAIPLAVGCGSEEKDGAGGGSGQPLRDTGSACEKSADCFGELCLTGTTFAELMDNGAEAEIPGGYCSLLGCEKNQAEGKCGPGGFCFDLEQFVDTPLTACFDECQTDADCRQAEGYVCSDFSGTKWTPMPRKACLPPSLICLLEVPMPMCPEVGDAGVEGGGGAAGSSGSAGAAGTGG